MQIDIAKPISQVTFAQLVGVGPRTVTQLLARGIIKRGGTGQEWLIDYTRHLREVAGARQTADGKLDLVAERAALTLEQRKVTEIKRRQMLGELVEIAGVKASLGRRISELRDSHLALPGRMAPVLFGAKTISEVQSLLDAEIRRTITAFVESLPKAD